MSVTNNTEDSQPFVTKEQVKHGAAKTAAIMAIATAIFLIVAVASRHLSFNHTEINHEWGSRYETVNSIANFSKAMANAAILTGSISALALVLAAVIQKRQEKDKQVGNDSRSFTTQEEVKHGAARVAAVMAVVTAAFLVLVLASQKLSFNHSKIFNGWNGGYYETRNYIANFSQGMANAAILTGSISAVALLLALGIQKRQNASRSTSSLS